MAIPKILNDLREIRDESITASSVTNANGTVTLVLPVPVSNGSLVKFEAPCNCTEVTGIQIDGKSYTVVDTVGNELSGSSEAWVSGSFVSIVLDTTDSKAYIQSGASLSSIDQALSDHNNDLNVHNSIHSQIDSVRTKVEDTEYLAKMALSAYGVTSGVGTAYTLEYEGYELINGNTVKFQLHVDSGKNPTLDINGTGAKPIKINSTDSFGEGNKAGMWFTAVYSESAGAYVVQWAQNHEMDAGSVKYGDSDMNSVLYDLESKVNILTAKEKGQTIAVTISNESTESWILVDGYWEGKYISTGA